MVKKEQSKNRRRRISAAAQKLAAELGIDSESLRGSGAQGRILLGDIKKYKAAVVVNTTGDTAYGQKVSLPDALTRKKSIKIRQLLAKKMEQAWQTIPHFYVTISVDMTDVVGLHHDLSVTINDFILAATSRALGEHPWVNASWDGEQGVVCEEINIAIATATDRGLFYPVLSRCNSLGLLALSEQAHSLIEKAMVEGALVEQDISGATFTITNMGMFGVESLSAIITPPQAAVLSVGSIKGEVVVDGQGEPAVAPIMRLTLSADHRVLDGADAAEFLDTIKCYLEAPVMLIDG
jgi:pyruvate dehydrogenase E2 component (dihydrolipoamide acetyltransferase)